MSRRAGCVVALVSLLALSCGEDEEVEQVQAPAYARASTPSYATAAGERRAPAVSFADITASAGIHFQHENGAAGKKWMPETMGSGCAFFDYDGDGADDAFLVNSTYWPGENRAAEQMPTSKLFRNLGDGSFEDISATAGLALSIYGMGAAVADYDADGDADVYLTTVGDNLLLRNEAGRFVDRADRAGVAGVEWEDDAGSRHPEWSTGAVWLDVDGDGWLDLFVTNYVRWSSETDLFFSFDGKSKSYATPQQYPGSTPRLYRNMGGGDGGFREITEEAGVFLPHAKSMGVAVADFDEDGRPDLVVTNDTQPNFLLRNTGEGFAESGLAAGIGYDEGGRARAGMGVDVVSLKNDGTQNIAIGNFSREALSLYEQQEVASVFLDVAGRSRLVQPTLPVLTFGLRFFDFDLDGFQDLILANGHIEPDINAVQKEIRYAQPPQLFWNDGNGALVDISDQTGGLFAQPLVGRGLAVADIEADGDPDVLLTTNAGPAYLLRNDGVTGGRPNALRIELRGTHPNPDALGATVTVRAGQLTQRATLRTGSSYLSQSSLAVSFGLGPAATVDRLEIRWADGTTQVFDDIATGARHRIEQGSSAVASEALRR